MGNLSALETLDLSHNELQDLSTEPNIFNLPANLTVLKLNDNHLQRFPVEPLVKVQNLSNLDLSNNLLESIDVKLIEKVKNGMNLHFEGTFSYNIIIFLSICLYSSAHNRQEIHCTVIVIFGH